MNAARFPREECVWTSGLHELNYTLRGGKYFIDTEDCPKLKFVRHDTWLIFLGL